MHAKDLQLLYSIKYLSRGDTRYFILLLACLALVLDNLILYWNILFLGLLTFVLLIGIVYKLKFAPKKKEVGLQKKEWEKDVVYLCQFFLCPSVRTISPFALKLETWLRVSGGSTKFANVT